ncbi:MAG: hemolysin family protein [Bacteroidetes bacterium]|nr:hemolysin family protein [Bacteroidota bacterium]MDA0902964.1 hemolysin family protein [Bacteroidota bacterium]MDA1241620.1 hemolysin family protein [Bacteroidota bacterium]
MDPDPSSSLAVVALSLLASAFFSGMEMAFVASSRLQTELRAQQSLRGQIVSFLSDRPQLFIASMLVGNNLALVLCGMESGALIGQWIFGVSGWQEASQPTVVLATQTLVTTAVVLVVAEFMPKSLFHASPNKWLDLFAFPLIVVFGVLALPAWLVMVISKALIRPFGSRHSTSQALDTLGAQDLDHFINTLSGQMEPEQELEHELQILKNALDLPEVQARDSMVPRNEVSGIELETSIEDLQREFAETGYSKLVVYKGDIDHIVGYVHAKDLFRRPSSLKEILLPTFVVPEPMPGDELLRQFLRRRRHLAVVLDEFGGTAGILTMEDIVEELLGEIDDEHDHEELDLEHPISEESWMVPARREIRVLNDTHGWELPLGDTYETLGGLVLHEVGDIPEEGTLVEVEGVQLVVREVSENRVEWVEVWPHGER